MTRLGRFLREPELFPFCKNSIINCDTWWFVWISHLNSRSEVFFYSFEDNPHIFLYYVNQELAVYGLSVTSNWLGFPQGFLLYVIGFLNIVAFRNVK